jgi:hypothetical protein
MWKHACHYGSDRGKSVIHAAGFVDIAALEGKLKTAATHTEAHRVHVDVVDKRGPIPCL